MEPGGNGNTCNYVTSSAEGAQEGAAQNSSRHFWGTVQGWAGRGGVGGRSGHLWAVSRGPRQRMQGTPAELSCSPERKVETKGMKARDGGIKGGIEGEKKGGRKGRE